MPSEFVYPKNNVLNYLQQNGKIDRFYGFGYSLIDSNLSTQYQVFSPEGVDPLYPKWYGEFVQASKDGNINLKFTNLTRSDVVIYPGFDEKNKNRFSVLNLLGVKYILDRVENTQTITVFNTDLFKKVYEYNGWKIYENRKALPRFFLASDYKVYSSPKEFSEMFFAKDFEKEKTILLDKDPKLNLSPLDKEEKISLISYKPNLIKFTSNTKGNHLLFLSDTYYPGWVAQIDGKETQIYKADYAFRAILVPNGVHKISFTFKSGSFRIGYIVSAFSVLVLFIFFLISRYDKRNIKK